MLLYSSATSSTNSLELSPIGVVEKVYPVIHPQQISNLVNSVPVEQAWVGLVSFVSPLLFMFVRCSGM